MRLLLHIHAARLRDRLIDLVSVGNLRHKPEELFALFRQFMMCISLPRLVPHARASSMGVELPSHPAFTHPR